MDFRLFEIPCRYANGLVVKLRTTHMDAVAISSLLSMLTGAVFISKQVDTIELRLPIYNLDNVFAILEKAKTDKAICNYSISEMTLREVKIIK